MILDALFHIANDCDEPAASIALTALQKEASRLAGREVEVEKTEDGSWIVLWMCFESSPPQKAATQAGAYIYFIDMMLRRKPDEDNLPEVDTKENTDGTDVRSPAVDS